MSYCLHYPATSTHIECIASCRSVMWPRRARHRPRQCLAMDFRCGAVRSRSGRRRDGDRLDSAPNRQSAPSKLRRHRLKLRQSLTTKFRRERLESISRPAHCSWCGLLSPCPIARRALSWTMAPSLRSVLPCRCEEEEDGSRVEQQRNHQDKPAQDVLVACAEQCCQIAHRTQVGLCDLPVAVHPGFLDLELGEGLGLNRKLVGQAGALGPPALIIRGAELGGCRE